MDFILYRSASLIEKGSEAYNDIFLVARNNNMETNVTGYLHSEDGYFVQYLEGPTVAVASVLEKIARDARHKNITTRASGPIGNRRFGRWDMALVDQEFELFRMWNRKQEFGSFGQAPLEALLAFFAHHDQTG